MNKDTLQEVWDKRRKEQKMTKSEIQAILQPQVRKSAFGQNVLVVTVPRSHGRTCR